MNSYLALSLGQLTLPVHEFHTLGNFICKNKSKKFSMTHLGVASCLGSSIGPSPSLLVAKCLKKAFLKSSQLRLLPAWSLVYQTIATPLKVRWKARHFMAGVAPLKPMWVLKPLRYFVRSPLSSYLGILGSMKWFSTGALLISCEKRQFVIIIIKVAGPL